MSLYDEYFTNEDKPYAENLNDVLLVSNVFDLTVPVVLPDDFSNGAWVDTGNKRKCHVSIVQVTDFDNLTVTGSSLTGNGALTFRFYPNFNSFGKIRGVDWNGSVDEVIVNDANGNSLCNVTEPGNFPNVSGLRTLQNFEIIVKVNGELEDLTLRLENKVKSARHTVSATVEDIDGLSDALDSIETINSNQDLLIENKVDKVNGKGLSTNDFTNTYKNKVDNVSTYTKSTFTMSGYTYDGYYINSNKVIVNAELTSGIRTGTYTTSIPYPPLYTFYSIQPVLKDGSYYPVLVKGSASSGNKLIITIINLNDIGSITGGTLLLNLEYLYKFVGA